MASATVCGMVDWRDVATAESEFAARVRAAFEVGRHQTVATVRADGGPRISGVECEFADGELRFGSMPGSRKSADLLGDPRCALHSPSVDPPAHDPAGWAGDAKVSGRAVHAGPLPAGGPQGDAFRVELEEVVRVGLNGAGDRLVVELWRPGRPLRRVERE